MVTLAVVILIMIALPSTLVIIFRHSHSLPISTDARILMSINIRAHVYQTLYWDAYLLLLFIFELAQMFIVTRMSVLACNC